MPEVMCDAVCTTSYPLDPCGACLYAPDVVEVDLTRGIDPTTEEYAREVYVTPNVHHWLARLVGYAHEASTTASDTEEE